MQAANDNSAPANAGALSFISMFSGIEAASVAFGPLGWRAVCFAEIEKFPSAVLAHHYPDVPNVGDMSAHDWSQYAGKVDIVCGGPPCQAFSVAGLRESLNDDRGNLSLVYMKALHAINPRNAIIENVPGWLSTKDNAFGCFLAGLVGASDALPPPKGRRWPNAGMVAGPKGRAAWRVLDAQYFGLAQRRKRVIVVADFGNGADPAAVLFEPESVRRDSPPSRETGQAVAPTISARTKGGGGLGTDFDLDGGLIHAPEIARCDTTREGSSQDYESTTMVAQQVYSIMPQNSGKDYKARPVDVAQPVMAAGQNHGNQGGDVVCVTGPISHALKAEGADASEGGTGRGTPIVCFSAKDYGADASIDLSPTLRAGGHTTSHANAGVMPAVAYNSEGCEYAHANEADASSVLSTLRDAVGEEAFTEWGLRVLGAFQSQEILRSWLHGQSIRGQAQNFRSFVDDCALPCAKTDAGGVLREVWVNGPDGRSSQGRGLAKQLAGKPGEALSVLPPEGASPKTDMQHLREAREGARLLRQALSAVQEVRRPAHGEGEPEYATSAVRRLTARECERLQGFQWLCSPDYPGAWLDEAGRWWSPDYTAVPWRGKPADQCPDGPRYKSLGNSWAVPKFRWLGERIQRLMPPLAANDNYEVLVNERVA